VPNPAALNFATSRPYPLGHGFSVEFRLSGSRLDAVWSPRLPHGRRGRKLLPAYRLARDRFLASLAADLGGPIAVLDL